MLHISVCAFAGWVLDTSESVLHVYVHVFKFWYKGVMRYITGLTTCWQINVSCSSRIVLKNLKRSSGVRTLPLTWSICAPASKINWTEANLSSRDWMELLKNRWRGAHPSISTAEWLAPASKATSTLLQLFYALCIMPYALFTNKRSPSTLESYFSYENMKWGVAFFKCKEQSPIHVNFHSVTINWSLGL